MRSAFGSMNLNGQAGRQGVGRKQRRKPKVCGFESVASAWGGGATAQKKAKQQANLQKDLKDDAAQWKATVAARVDKSLKSCAKCI